jgi:predicted transposase/invertase (TIGR01784 family)
MDERLVQNLDLESLTLDSTSYISTDLEEYFSDLVWTARYKNQTDIRITFLFEHKSYVQPFPHIQLGRYIFEQIELQGKTKGKLNVIIPIVVYHGKDKWHVREFHEYFEGIDEILMPYIPNFKYQLTDLSQYSDEELISKGYGKLLNVFLAMLHARDMNYIRNNLQGILTAAEQYSVGNENFLRLIFVYLFRNAELSGDELIQISETIQNPLKNIAMSTYDLLIQKGRQEGVVLGRQEEANEKNREFTISLLNSTDFSDEKIANLVGVTIQYVSEIRNFLSKK